MHDSERLIKAWELFRASSPYGICDTREFCANTAPSYYMSEMVGDTIAILKEQSELIEQLKTDLEVAEVIEKILLKDQEEAIPISWLESFTRLKCMDYVHGIVLDLIKTWKSVK